MKPLLFLAVCLTLCFICILETLSYLEGKSCNLKEMVKPEIACHRGVGKYLLYEDRKEMLVNLVDVITSCSDQLVLNSWGVFRLKTHWE